MAYRIEYGMRPCTSCIHSQYTFLLPCPPQDPKCKVLLAQLLPTLEKVLRRHLCWLEKFIQSDG